MKYFIIILLILVDIDFQDQSKIKIIYGFLLIMDNYILSTFHPNILIQREALNIHF